MSPQVAILMGSSSDRPAMTPAADVLAELGIPCEVRILSAHRTPARTIEFATGAAARGIRVIIAGAGGAAHLAGVIAAHTLLPVLGVPLPGSALNGLDALLATVQMPSGVPVATLAIGGAANAALLAAEILALSDPALAAKLAARREATARAVQEQDREQS